jgi:hypothetical protein
MEPSRFILVICALAVLALSGLPGPLPPLQAAPPETCGVWRWAIKTLSDLNSGQVDFTPRARTIRKLRELEPPANLGRNTPRVRPTEYRTYRVRARIREHKWVCCGTKDDGDYHLVLADPRNRRRTMIAELADPDCPGARDSAKVGTLRAVRHKYNSLFGQPPKGRFEGFEDPPLVFVTGVGFFDAVHGQKGVAPNGIEIHPVLDFESVPEPP